MATINTNPTTTPTTRNTTSSCQPGEQNWECCTAESPCNSPLTGDCDENGCAGDLVCGEQNCGAADPTGYMDCCDFKRCSSDEDCFTTGMFCTANGCGEGSSESCCRTQPDKRMIWGEPEPEPTRTRTPSSGRCSPRNTGRLAWTCCSTYTPCGHGEGDCDSNSDCKRGHFCGNGNCKDLVPNLPRESHTMDCCERNPLQDIVRRPFDPIRPPLLLFYQQRLQLDRVLQQLLIWKHPRHRRQLVLETTLVVLLTHSAGREKATATMTKIAL